MLSLKKLKLLTTNYSLLIFGGIFISLFFVIVIGHFSTPVLAAIDVPAATGLSTNSLADTAVNIINAFLGLVGVIALGIFVYGGYLWMFSGGDPKKIDKAKKVLISATIGLIIILISWAIVSFIFNAVGGGDGNNNNNNVNPPLPPALSTFRVKWISPKDGASNVPICHRIAASFADHNGNPINLSIGTINEDTVKIREYCGLSDQCAAHRPAEDKNGDGAFNPLDPAEDKNNDGIFNPYDTLNPLLDPGEDINRNGFFDLTADSCMGDNYCGFNMANAGAFNKPGDETFGFIPNKEWDKDTYYWIYINGVQSASALVADPFNSFFTTGELSDNTPPTVAAVSPLDDPTNTPKVCRTKPITAKFSEDIWPQSLKKINNSFYTLTTTDDDYASLEIDPVAPASLAFGLSQIQPDIAVYSPLYPFDKNKIYYPVFRAGEDTDGDKTLDAGEDFNGNSVLDGIEDMCGNFLDQVPADTFYGSPRGDYGDSGSTNPDVIDYSFTTEDSDDTQCDPIIEGTVPAQAYYDHPDNIITISGKNFGDIIPRTVLLSSGVTVDASTDFCLNPLAVPDYTNDGWVCIRNWQDDEIKIALPARGTTTSAVDGPVQVKLGGYAACDANICLAGSKKGQSCTLHTECLSGDSNTDFSIDLASPHISSQSSSEGPKGQPITLAGTDFGDGDADDDPDDIDSNDDQTIEGIVRFINVADRTKQVTANFPCGSSSWTVNQIIIEFPIDTGAVTVNTGDVFDVQIERTDGRKSNLGIFKITAGTPGPVMCSLAPDCGPTGTPVAIGGKRFGTAGTVSFGSALATVIPPWGDTQITATSSAQLADGTYPVKVVSGGDSNTLPFSTICSGRPRVVESAACTTGAQTPSPYKDSTDACVNTSAISARFNMDMASGDNTDPNWDNSIRNPANVEVMKCNLGDPFDNLACSSPVLDDNGILELLGNSGFKFEPTFGWAQQNRWYRVTVKTNVQSQENTSMGTDYIWSFRIADSATACPIDSLTVNPPSTAVNVGTPVNYTAVSAANNCNFIGACNDYVYLWSAVGGHSAVGNSTACNETATTASATPIGTPDIITANIPAESKLNTANLTITNCGNNITEPPEQCDDGNSIDTDACSNICKSNSGSGSLLPKVVEQNSCTIGTQSPSPYRDQADVCKNANIAVRFNKNMDDATLVKGNMIVENCGADPACAAPAAFDISGWTLTAPPILPAWGSNGEEGFTLDPPVIEFQDDNNYYRVTLDATITAGGYQLDGNGNGIPEGSQVDDYSWTFKTSGDSCEVKSISISPANMSVAVGSLKPISAIPQAENCNILTGSDYDWSWAEASAGSIATVTNNDADTNGKKDPNQIVAGVKAGATTVSASIPAKPAVPAGTSNITVTNTLSCSDAGLTAVWKFDEDSGSVALDSGASGANDGILTSDLARSSSGCRFGKCLDLNGTDQYAAIDKNLLNLGISDFTVEGWVKMTDNGSTTLISKQESGDQPGYTIHINGGFTYFRVMQNLANRAGITGTTKVNDDKWHHIAGVRQGIDIKLYVDGKLEGSASNTAPANVDSLYTTLIGVFGEPTIPASLINYLPGKIDEVRLWNKALEESEIKSIYNQACMNVAVISCENPNLKAVWKLDENLGIAAGDSSGNHNDGQLNNNPGRRNGTTNIFQTGRQYASTTGGSVSGTTFQAGGNSPKINYDFNVSKSGSYDLMLSTQNWNSGTKNDIFATDSIRHNLIISVDGVQKASLDSSSTPKAPPASPIAQPTIISLGNIEQGNRVISIEWNNDWCAPVGDGGCPAGDSNFQINSLVLSDNCKYGKCLKFDGVDDYIKMPDSDSISMTNALTMEAWVKASDDTQRYIFSKHSAINIPDYEYTLVLTADGKIRSEFRKGPLDGDYKTAYGTSDVTDGNWHHIAVTYDGSDIKTYNNGILESTVNWGFNIQSNVATALFIGRIGLGDTTTYFKGSIDEPRVWDKALTQEEIISAMSQECKVGGAGATLQCTNDVVGIWNFDEGNGTLAADGSRNRNDGTVNGAAVWNATGCQFGKCLELDGTDADYVLANQMTNFPTNEITTSFWIKTPGNEDGGIISYATNTVGQQFNDWMIYHIGGKIEIYRGSVAKNTGVTVNDNKWHHIAVSWRGGDGKLKTYKDGILVDDSTLLKDEERSINQGGSLVVGQDQDSVGGLFNSDQAYKGSIDEVRIYNRALSATEIENTYQKSMNACQAAPLICSNPNLAAVWKFDEAAGDAAVDSTDNNNQGVLQNNPTRLSSGCKFGNCLEFNGTNQSVNIKAPNIDPIDKNFTIETWFYTPEAHNSSNNEPFISKAIYTNPTDNSGFFIGPWSGIGGNQFIGFGLFNNGNIVTIKTPERIDQIAPFPGWHHAAGTYDGTTAKLYIDGNLKGQQGYLGGIRTNTTDILIGQHPYDGGQHYKGRLDEVRFWKKALEESEIKSIYNQACMNIAAISCENPNLKAVWKLDENSGIAAGDSSGNHNDGQLNNSPTWESADCKFGKCLKFDGIDDYMSLSSPASLNFSGSATIEAWVKSSEDACQTIYGLTDKSIGSGDYQPIYIGNGCTDTLANELITIARKVNGVIIYVVGYTTVNRNELLDGNWHHLTAVFDGTAVKIYIDGLEKTISTGSGSNNGSYGGISNPNNAEIGSRVWNGLREAYFKGVIDEPRIWDKALTQEEIISAMSQECKVGGTGATLQCTNDVVGIWNFDDGAGSMAADWSRNKNNGRLNNVNVWAVNGCQLGGCLNLDGSATDYVEVPDNSSLDISNEVTVMLWANIENINSTRVNVLLDKMTSDPKGPFGILLQAGDPQLEGRFILENGTVIYLDPGFVPPTNQWHHYVITFKSGEQKFYYDGKEQTAATKNVAGKLIQNNLPIIIGSGAEREINYNTDAVIDEVRIYNRALSAAEIANTYQKSMTQCVEATLYCSNPELTAVWKMDEGIGVVAGDSTANNLDGVLKNGLNNTGWKSGADCKFTDGKCLEFDGINNNPTNPADADTACTPTKDSCTKGDIVEIPDSSIIDFGKNPFTIEGWVKMPPAATVLDISNYSGTVGPGVPGTLISKQSSGSVAGFVIHTNNSSCGDGTLYFRVNDAIGSPDYDSKDLCSGNISDNEWHHFAALREGTAIRLYIDGLRIGEANASKVQSVNNDYPLYVGGYRNEGDWPSWFPAKFKGSLDELRIWKKALTDDQIQGIYNGGNGQQCLAPQKGSACDLDLTAPSCQPNVGLCESGDVNLRCSIKSCTCQEKFIVNPTPPNPTFAPDSVGKACRNTAITVNFNEPIDASTIKTATTTVKEKAPPLLSENFDAPALPAGWTTLKTSGNDPLDWERQPIFNADDLTTFNGYLHEQSNDAAGWFVSPNALASTTNFRISFDAGSLGNENNAIGIAWNYINEDNYYRLIWEDPNDWYGSLEPSRLVLQKRVNGPLVENPGVQKTSNFGIGGGLAEKKDFVVPIGQSAHFYIDVVGTKITVSNDSGTLLSYDDSSAPAILPGKIAFYTNDSDGGIFYDNLIVTEYEATNIPGTVELYSLQAATGNLLADGDMEAADTDVWQTYATPKVLEKSTAEKKNGGRSLHIITDAPFAGTIGEGTMRSFMANTGDAIRVRGWVKVVKGAFVAALKDDQSGWSVQTPNITSNAWTEFALDYSTPSTGSTFLWLSTPNGGFPDSEFYIDDISVTVEHNLAVDISTAVNGSTLTITPRQYLDADRNYTLNFAGDHLVSLWNFDEGSGTTVKDWRGGMNGALVGLPLWKSGADCKFGSCLEFDGRDGIVQYVNAGNFSGKYSDRLTVSAWIKNNSSRVGMSGNNAGWDDIIAGDCGNFVFTVGDAGKVKFQNQCGFRPGVPQGGVVSDKSVNDDQWHHVAATYDGSTLRMYIDGKLDGETTGVTGAFTAGNLWIGSTFYDEELFSGRIDDARIWSRALTDKEIADVANGGAPNPGNGNVIFSSNGNPLENDYVWPGLTTGTEICKIGKAEIEFSKMSAAGKIYYKGSDSFTCAGASCVDDISAMAGNQHQSRVNIYSANGGPLGGVMTYGWTKSTDVPFDIWLPATLEPLITPQSVNGQGVLTVDVNGGLAGTAKASANVTVALCENPWVGDQLSVPWTESDTNFSVWYCRDAGNMQDTTDDLPSLTVQEVTTSPGSPKPMKEYFYYDANSVNDAIGIRVYANPGRLPLTEWLDQNANVSGGQSGSFNGWQSVKAGRSLYVSAMNDVVDGIFNNIYLISYSDKSSSTLIGIYNQMISNWKFMVNGISDADIAKLQRDIRRIDDLGKIATALDSYKAANGSYPKLDAGTYLPGMSTSVWPSWQASFGNALQTGVPKDPINQLSNLVGYWKLDEGTGIAANDSSSRGNIGRLMNNPVWKSGADCKVGGCLELNMSDTDDYVIINPISDFPTTEITTAYWTKTSDSGDGVISYGSSVTPNNDWLIFSSDNISPHRNWSVNSDVSVNDNAWHFVAVTWKSSDGKAMVYKDGILAKTVTITDSVGTTITSGGSLVFGQDQDIIGGGFQPSQSYSGLIDEVQIYNRALSGSEIALLAGGGFSEATGWNQDTNSFQCSAGTDFDSHIYHYQYNNANSYNLYSALEYVGPNTGNTWRQTTTASPLPQPLTPYSCYNYAVQGSTCVGASDGLLFTIPDTCLADFGATAGGDSFEIYCRNGIDRWCLSGEACPWRTDITSSDNTTCSRAGLSSDLMGTALCSLWNGISSYSCDLSNQKY